MQAWLRTMAIPRILCRRVTPWTGRTPGCLHIRQSHIRTIASSPQFSVKNIDDSPGPELHQQLEYPDASRLLERVAQQQQKESEDGWRGPAAMAGQFAANVWLPQSPACANELQSWFSVIQDDGKFPIRNMEFYSQLSEYPRPIMYPGLPQELFRKPPDSHALISLYNHLKKYGEVSHEGTLVKRPTQYTWRMVITVRLGDNIIHAQGEDTTMQEARIGASMDLIHQLHETKKLEALIGLDWTPPNAVSEATKTVIKPNPLAKLHVYNYAARFGQVPIFQMEKTEASDKIFATVSIPYVGLEGKAMGTSEEEAEAMACAIVKEEAEKRQREMSSQSTLSLRDADTVNVDNAEDILTYYESLRASGNFFWLREKVTPVGSLHSCRVFWQQDSMVDKPLTDAVVMQSASHAKRAASLMAAVILVRENHALFTDYRRALEINNGVVPRRISPTAVQLRSDVMKILEQSINTPDIEDFLADRVDPFPMSDLDSSSKQLHQLTKAIKLRNFQHEVYQSHEERSEELKKLRDHRRFDPYLAEAELQRSQLPVNQKRTEILSLIKNHSQCVIVGSAGSGKSTQIPQIILDDAISDGRGAFCNIICTQPRRVAAVSLATRVCNERGEEPGDVVGYRISGEGKEAPFGGSITFTTAEMLILQLEKATDEMLENVSHIIVDEVHERGNPTDRLLMTIKLVFSDRMKRGFPVPKLIMMSATIQDSLFEQYFEMRTQNGDSIRPPLIDIPTRQFPITTKYLADILAEQEEFAKYEDNDGLTPDFPSPGSTKLKSGNKESTLRPIEWESQYEIKANREDWLQQQLLVASTLAHVSRTTTSGSILVFLAGWKELQHMQTLLLEENSFLGVNFTDQDKYEIILLHSSFPDSFAAALADTRPGVRRILLATNMAETSLTFADVKYVVDSGKHRLLEYSDRLPSNTLYRKWVSRSNVAQRAGRVGRVQPGEYYAVFSSEQHTAMDPYPQPDALNSGTLQLLCLRARTHFPKLPIPDFFSRWLSPPPEKDVVAALGYLSSIGALSPDGKVTAVGQTLCRLNVDPSIGKMILLGVLFRCLDPVLMSAAVMTTHMSPWGVPESIAGQGRVAQLRRSYAIGTNSDIISTLNAYRDFSAIRNESGDIEARNWAEERFMLVQRFQGFDLVSQKLESLLGRLSIFDRYDREGSNQRSNRPGLVKALISVGLHPNVAVHNEGYQFIARGGIPVTLSAQSVLRPGHGPGKNWEKNPLHGTLCSYMSLYSVSETDQDISITGASPISPLAAALFCPSLKVKEGDDSILVMDGWIPLYFSEGPDVAKGFFAFKQTWDKLLSRALTILCQSAVGPFQNGNEERKRLRALSIVTQALADLFEQDERQCRKKIGWS